MGVFEAGFGPGIPYLLSCFYLRKELGLRIGIFLSAAPLATCFSGALAYATPEQVVLICHAVGFSSLDAQGLSAPPFFVSFLLTISTTWIADKTQQRGITIMILSAVGGIGYIILATAKSVGARYFATFLAAGGVFPSIANILPWVMNNQGSDTRRVANSMFMSLIGQCGPILGTNVYPTREGPYYVKGQAVCAAFMLFTTLLALALRQLNAWDNQRLDQKYGKLEENSVVNDVDQDVVGGEDDYGPRFRYIL
ncbi:MAG: hypothetical protein Q9162_003439 [Coniocarpon cinnabarinum]